MASQDSSLSIRDASASSVIIDPLVGMLARMLM